MAIVERPTDALALPSGAQIFNGAYPLHAAKVGGLAWRLTMTISGLAMMLLGSLAVFVLGADLLYRLFSVVKIRVETWQDPWATASTTGVRAGAARVPPRTRIVMTPTSAVPATKDTTPSTATSRSEAWATARGAGATVAVAGTHGKTTTTSMVAALLDAGGVDPTVINGGIINAYGTNARLGAGSWMVVEADESDGTFLKLPTDIAIVTNIDAEHLDHYGSLERLIDAFRRDTGGEVAALGPVDRQVVQLPRLGVVVRALGVLATDFDRIAVPESGRYVLHPATPESGSAYRAP